MSKQPTFDLMGAESASERMQTLLQFIEYWLGPRRPEYGEPAEALAALRLPRPLHVLYEFAGRWPRFYPLPNYEPWNHALAHQDHLKKLDRLQFAGNDRLIFVDENQGVWECSTLTHGDDPPVWCIEDRWSKQERLACSSLSTFLVSFVLQELMFGSRLALSDKGIERMFAETQQEATVLWRDGPYVLGNRHNFALWNGLLVGVLYDSHWFAANNEQTLDFLDRHQGRVNEVIIMVGNRWELTIKSDGSGFLRYYVIKGEMVPVPAGTFNFAAIYKAMEELPRIEGRYNSNPTVSFRRDGQGRAHGKFLSDKSVVRDLFVTAVREAIDASQKLRDCSADEWA
jgi:hypothetical protein